MLSIATRRRLGLQASEVPFEALTKQAPFGVIGSGLRHHDKVPTGQRRVHAEDFPREAFQFVSIDRSLGRAPRDRQAEPSERMRVRATEDREETIARAGRLCEDVPELLRSM
jgi:hypothetical protein